MTPEREELLDRCLQARREGRDPEEVLRSDPAAAEVRPLLTLASELKSLPPAEPTGEAMTQLAARIAAESAPRTSRRPVVRRALAWAAGILLSIILIGWGGSAASAGATPGDALYPVKMLTERVRMFATFSKEGRVELRIVFSEERLKEAVRMHANGKGIDTDLLKEMLDEAKAAIDATPALAPDSRNLIATRVSSMTSYQKAALSELNLRANADEKAKLAPIMTKCSEQCMAACLMLYGYCPHCSGMPGPATCPMPSMGNEKK